MVAICPGAARFRRLNPAQTSKVFAWAQLSASRWQGWGLPDPASWVPLAWQWVRDRTDNGRGSCRRDFGSVTIATAE